MPSTEFLLYLIVVIFAVYVIVNYYKDISTHNQSSPIIQYKYIPVYGPESDSKNNDNNGRLSRLSQNPGPGQAQAQAHVQAQAQAHVQAQAQAQAQAHGCYNQSICSRQGRCTCIDDINIDVHVDNRSNNEGPRIPILPIDPLRKFDHDVIDDDFTPPFRRSYYDEHNYRLRPGLYPTYTRGPPGRFRKIGVLVAEGVAPNDKFKFLLLMGRQKYNNRDYEYFATSAESDQRLKFYIETRGKEINHDDIVKIPELEGYSYKFREDQDLSPKYDPYLPC